MYFSGLNVLFAIFTTERQCQWRERPGSDVRRAPIQRRVEKQVRSRSCLAGWFIEARGSAVDVERRAGIRFARFCPRFDRGRRRVSATKSRARQRRPVSTEEMQFERFKWKLRRVL